MNKRVISVFVLSFFVLVLMVSFVSAGFFGDFLKKLGITGKVTQTCTGTISYPCSSSNHPSDFCNADGTKKDCSELSENICIASGCELSEETCGNGFCGTGEDSATCPEDCGIIGNYCGDNTCDNDEDCSTCETDCGVCPSEEPSGCIESDSGFDPFTYGTMIKNGVGYVDQCYGDFGPDSNLLGEWICDNSINYPLITEIVQHPTGGWAATVECPFGCSDGACVGAEDVCVDTDGGKDYSTKGIVHLFGLVMPEDEFKTDSCYHSASITNGVLEYYCDNGLRKDIAFDCPNGCSDGACVGVEDACGDGVCSPESETCSTCPTDCLSQDEICCNNLGIEGDCCSDAECDSSSTCIDNVCTLPEICIGGRQDYSLFSLQINSKCGINFKSNILNSLSSVGKTFSLENKKVRKIFNITANDSIDNATLDFVLNQDDFLFPLNQLFVYTENSSGGWDLLSNERLSLKSGSLYTYTVSVSHFSLFLFAEPDYCGNGIFEENYYEECDGTDNCNSVCECESGYESNNSGICVKEKSGDSCSEQGNQTCQGYNLYECNESLEWESQGAVLDKCGVECVKGTTSCDGEDSLFCSSLYQWVSQGKVSGQCSYYSGDDSVYCGDGNCDIGENKSSSSNDFKKGIIKESTPRTIFIILIILIFILIVFIFIIFFKHREKQSFNAQTEKQSFNAQT